MKLNQSKISVTITIINELTEYIYPKNPKDAKYMKYNFHKSLLKKKKCADFAHSLRLNPISPSFKILPRR